MVVAVVVTAVVTAVLGVDRVVVAVDVTAVLLAEARGTKVLLSGFLKALNPSVVPSGKSLVPGIPPMPSLDEEGNAGNAA